MRTILVLLRKEFRQIKRNRTILPIIFVLPIIQLLILVHATTFEIKKVNLTILDFDKSATSANLISKLQGSGFFKVVSNCQTLEQAERQLAQNQADMIMTFPLNFEKELLNQGHTKVQFIPNAINSNFATLAFSYASAVVADYNGRIMAEWPLTQAVVLPYQIAVKPQFWYNPELNYKWYMFPGIMVILISMIGLFLSGLNLVREKEIGTSEQLNVTPIRKHHFIIAKLVPFLIIGLFELLFATLLGRVIYGVPLVGSIWVLMSFTFVYLLAILGIGLFISTMVETQQQMMFLAFFVVIVFILISGIFTPTESMPIWVQKFNLVNPIAYFMKVIRMVMLKGSGFADIYREFVSISVFAIGILSLAIWRYRKTS